jgi:hypothetical protein
MGFAQLTTEPENHESSKASHCNSRSSFMKRVQPKIGGTRSRRDGSHRYNMLKDLRRNLAGIIRDANGQRPIWGGADDGAHFWITVENGQDIVVARTLA